MKEIDLFGRGARRPWARRAHPLGLILLAVLVDAFISPACQPKDPAGPVVMTVGTRAIPMIEFEEAFWTAQKSDSTLRPDTTSLRRFVPVFTDKVRLELLATEAIPRLEGGPRDRADEDRERLMVEALRKDAYGKATRANKAELSHAYELFGRKLRLQYIFLTQEEQANRIIQALRGGALFSKVAEERSEDEESKKAGGEIGWVQYTELGPETRDKVFALKPGEIGGPYPWANGYQIFKVEEEGVNSARGPFEKERKKLEYGIVAPRVREAQKKYQDDLLRRYHFKMDPAEVAWLTVFLREKTATVKRGLPAEKASSTIDLDAKPAPADELPWKGSPFSLADTGRVLASFDPPDGRVTPPVVLDQLMTDAPMAWPTFQAGGDVERLIRNLVLERLEIREATARGIDKRTEIARQISRSEMEIRTRVFTRTVIRPKARPSDEQLREYYEAHKAEYSEPERRRFLGVNSTLWDSAVKAMKMLQAGRTPEEVQAALAPADTSLKATGSAGTGFLTYGKSPLLDPVIFHLPLGGVSDPIPVGRTFTVAKVVEIQPAKAKTFEEVKDAIAAKVIGVRLAEVRGQMIAETADKYPAAIRWDRLRKARLEKPSE